MTRKEIEAIIPHRDPFLLLDEIVDFESMKHGTGIKHVKVDEDYFRGHFPEKPVMPGVLIVEALAQTGAVVILSNPDFKGKIAYFTGLKSVKWRKSVFPGDTLELNVEITKVRGSFGFGSGRAYVGEDLVCEAELSFAIN